MIVNKMSMNFKKHINLLKGYLILRVVLGIRKYRALKAVHPRGMVYSVRGLINFNNSKIQIIFNFKKV